MDQGSSFTSKAEKSFCNSKGIKIIYSPVYNHRTIECVERTIGSLKNFVLTYAKEKDHGNHETMVERALSALRFAANATLKITPFEAHHGRETNTVLRNLTQKPSLQNLNWEMVLKRKSAFLDSNDPRAVNLPHPKMTNWEDRSDADYDVEHINHPRKLVEDPLVSIADMGSAPADATKNSRKEKNTDETLVRTADGILVRTHQR